MKIKYLIISVLLAVILFVSGNKCVYSLELNQEGYYGIYYNSVLFGYSHYFVNNRISLAGKEYLKVSSDSSIRTIENEKPVSIDYISETTYEDKKLIPSFFDVLQKISKSSMNIQVLFSVKLIAQKNVYPDEKAEYFYESDENMNLLCRNMWGKAGTFLEEYIVLTRLAQGNDKKKEFKFFDPVTRSIEKANISLTPSLVDAKINSKTALCEEYIITDEADNEKYRIYLAKNSRKLLKLVVSGSPLTIEVSDESIISKYKNTKGVNFETSGLTRADFMITEPENIDYLKVKFKGNVWGLMPVDFTNEGYSQKFDGKIDGSTVDGVFTIKTSQPSKDSFDFPIAPENLSDMQKYLKPQSAIESDNQIIINQARVITARINKTYNAVEAVAQWIKSRITSGQSVVSALNTLDTRSGNSESIAYLFTALCRASKIPAKVMGGLIYKDGFFIPGYWVLVYTAKDTWIAVDPSDANVGKISAARIALWQNGETLNPEIEVENFSPKPVMKLSFFKKEFNWPVGEERTYQISQYGDEIGKEKILVKEFSLFNDRESYVFTDQIDISSKNLTAKYNSSGNLSTYCQPLFYNIKTANNGKETDESYLFYEDFLKRTLTLDGRSEYFKSVYSPGVYLWDDRFFSQFALSVSQLPSFNVGNEYTLYYYNPQTMKIRPFKFKIMAPEQMYFSGKMFAVVRCDVDDGMIFWITKKGVLLKYEIPGSEIEGELAGIRNL